jgi:TolB-like protein
MLAFGLLACMALVSAEARAAGMRTIAISYFDNNTGNPAQGHLGKGLADMLITDLSGIGLLQIVERDKLNQVLKELKLSQSKFIDPKTAQKLGKGLAAEYIMTGGYVLAGGTLRIDCRILQVATGKVVLSDSVEGKKDDFFSLEKDLVDLLVKVLDLKLGSPEKNKLRRNQTQSFEAWNRYSAGLDASDRGDNEKAQADFQAALEADPSYAAAKSARDRLRLIFQKTDQQKDAAQDQILKSLDPKAADFPAKVNQLLQGYGDADTAQLGGKIALLRWLAERDLAPSEANGVSRIPGEILGFVSRYLENVSQWAVIPSVCEYVVTRFPKDRMAQSQCKTYLNVLDQQEKARSKVPEAFKARSLEERRKEASLDWERALLDNEPAILKLFALYAKKTRK